MSTAKFEQLIDLIINEDQEKAEQLFHEIVVEKSREIYESMMEEEMSGDMSEELMREISQEEEANMAMGETEEDELADLEDEPEMPGDEMPGDMGDEMPGDMGDEMPADMGSEEPATKDDIMNLEDKLDQILAQFEEEQGEEEEEEGEEEPAAPAGEEAGEEEPEESPVMEAHELKAVGGGKTYDKFGKMGDNGDNTKSPVANKGQMGMAGSPVKFSGASETMPSSPKANTGYVKQGGDLISSPKNAIDGAGKLGSGKGESTPKPKNEDPGKSKSPVVSEAKKIVKKIVK